MESVGVPTAFITIPGHIYAAFSLSTDADGIRRIFSRTDELIFVDDTAWLPVEITMSQSSLEEAWQTGAKQ